MDNVSRISMFVAVVKHQSFAGAARSLGLTGPALSKQVQALEEQLGAKLLHRTTRHISLTEEGAIYFERASKALEDLAEAEQLLHDQQARGRNAYHVLDGHADGSDTHHPSARPVAMANLFVAFVSSRLCIARDRGRCAGGTLCCSDRQGVAGCARPDAGLRGGWAIFGHQPGAGGPPDA